MPKKTQEDKIDLSHIFWEIVKTFVHIRLQKRVINKLDQLDDIYNSLKFTNIVLIFVVIPLLITAIIFI